MEDSFVEEKTVSSDQEANVPPEGRAHLIIWQVIPP